MPISSSVIGEPTNSENRIRTKGMYTPLKEKPQKERGVFGFCLLQT